METNSETAPEGLNKDPKKMHRPGLRVPGFFGELVRTVIFVVAVTVLFDMAIPRSLVEGRSMQPTFQDGDRLVVSRVNYLLSEPTRGDIVVFNSVNPYEEGVMLIKRIIGVPGDTVEIRDQHVYINGELLDEPYVLEDCSQFRCTENVWVLAPDEYFVMGDNRNNSKDSRAFDPVPKDHIVGTVLFRYWPLNALRIFGPQDYDLTGLQQTENGEFDG